MRTAIHISVFIIISFSSFGQDFRYFDNNYKLDWSRFEQGKVTPELLKANFETLKDNPHPELEYILKDIDTYHLIDIDNDKTNELIYNGWNGGEGEMIVVYKVNENQYKEVQRFFGCIKDIRKSDSGATRLIVDDYACCAGYIDHLETFDYNQKTRQFEIVNSIARLDFTTKPSQFSKPVKFQINDTPFYLRYSPEICAGPEDDEELFDAILEQNISAIYNLGGKGTAYAESTDSTGHVWWFVIMDSKPDSGESLYYDGNNVFEHYKPVGWISSKEVTKTE